MGFRLRELQAQHRHKTNELEDAISSTHASAGGGNPPVLLRAERRGSMESAIAFVIGLIIGGAFGAVMMGVCCANDPPQKERGREE